EETIGLSVNPTNEKPVPLSVPSEPNLKLVASVRPIKNIGAAFIPPGSHAVSIFLLNGRFVKGKETYRSFIFQAEMTVLCAEGFLGRPDLRGALEMQKSDGDEAIADLHYRDVLEYAVGHGVSAEPAEIANGTCKAVRTCWIPCAEVPRVDHINPPGVELR